MKTMFIAAAVVAVLGPSVASASSNCPNVPRAQWISDAQITAKAKGTGYKVRSLKAENGCLEAYALDKRGNRVEVYFHPGNGDAIRVGGKNWW